jgi:uncharacterized protein Yka (UPF0111/DUF47 family)
MDKNTHFAQYLPELGRHTMHLIDKIAERKDAMEALKTEVRIAEVEIDLLNDRIHDDIISAYSNEEIQQAKAIYREHKLKGITGAATTRTHTTH